jgi:hypothetical protein
MERVKIDLKNGVADTLPEGVRFVQAVRKYNGWQLTFTEAARAENSSYQLFMATYYDESGTEYMFNSWSTVSGYTDGATGAYVELSDAFAEEFALTDYPYDTVYLTPVFTRSVKPDAPVVIEVR